MIHWTLLHTVSIYMYIQYLFGTYINKPTIFQKAMIKIFVETYFFALVEPVDLYNSWRKLLIECVHRKQAMGIKRIISTNKKISEINNIKITETICDTPTEGS